MTMALRATMTGPGHIPPTRAAAPRRAEAGPLGAWGEPPDGDADEANATRWPWDARLVGFLATAAATCWGLLIAATLGLLDWLA